MLHFLKHTAITGLCVLGVTSYNPQAQAADKVALRNLILNFGTVSAAVEDKALTSEEFATKMVDCNRCELDLAKQAAKKASSADVRNYAQMLVEDHEKMSKDLKSFIADKKIGIVTGTSKEHKEQLAELTKATGKDYDQKFLQTMIENHEKVLKTLKSCSKDSRDASVRDICEKSIPTIQKHLDEAKALQKKL